MQEQDLTPEQLLEAVYDSVMQQLLNGHSRTQIVDGLVNQGITNQTACEIVDEVIRLRKAAYRKAGFRNMAFSVLWCLGGIAIAIITYKNTTGSALLATYGAFGLGLFQFCYGLRQIWSV